MMRATSWGIFSIGLVASAWANVAPTVVIESATMRAGTPYMDVVYRVNDPDDATVKTRALAFVNGERTTAALIKPVTFVEGTADKLGDAIPTNTSHTLTWNVGADWNVTVGQIKFEVLALDGRGLMPINWITVPAAGGQPALTIENAEHGTGGSTRDALYWLYASGDPGLTLENGQFYGSEASGGFAGVSLEAHGYGGAYVLKAMNLNPAARAELDYLAKALRVDSTPIYFGLWAAKDEPYAGLSVLANWGTGGGRDFVRSTKDVVRMAVGASCSIGITSGGNLVEIGYFGTFGSSTAPSNLTDVSKISISGTHALALRADGTLVSWGAEGEISVPSELTQPGAVIAIAAGGGTQGAFSVAVKSDGTVVAWGNNTRGQTNIPAGLSGVVAVAAGTTHALALKNDGTVVSWGFSTSSAPIQVPAGLNQVVAIAASGSGGALSSSAQNLALRSDGTVVAWGASNSGQLAVPDGLNNVREIGLGINVSVALKHDGTLVAWGSGASLVPTGLTGVQSIAVGHSAGFAIKTDQP